MGKLVSGSGMFVKTTSLAFVISYVYMSPTQTRLHSPSTPFYILAELTAFLPSKGTFFCKRQIIST